MTLAERHTRAAQIERALPDTDGRAGACLYYAHAAASILWAAGLRPVIQAGTMQWPIVRREDDDGRTHTHYGYHWQPDHPASVARRAAGGLPELHAWVALPDAGEILDFSTRDFKRLALMAGLRWTAADPPDYLWCHVEELADRWTVYRADPDATVFVAALLWTLYQPEYLRPAAGRLTPAPRTADTMC